MNQRLVQAQTNFMAEIFVDGFAGGGGTSTGYEFATGRPADIAINHDPAAIRLHKANHPYTEHYQTSIWDVDPRTACKGRPVGLAWFSPDCKHFSKARGGKPVNKNIRSLSWVVIRWALDVRPRVIMMENVEEIQTWGPLMKVIIDGEEAWVPDPDHVGETFQAFIKMLSTGVSPDDPAIDEVRTYLKLRKNSRLLKQLIAGLGYNVEYRELVAADYGAPTTRKRFVLVARCDGAPIVWPESTHGRRNSEEVKSGKLLPWRSAAEIIDWSIPGYSIFDSKEKIKELYGVKAIRPLADNTLRRVIRGVDKFTIKSGNPFLVECNHNGDGHLRNVLDPVNTVTGKYTGGVVNPVMAPFTFPNTTGSQGADAGEPVHTVTSAGNQILGASVMAPFTFSNTGGSVGMDVGEPVHTIRTAGGQVLAAAQLMSIGQTGGGDRIRDIRDPAPTTVSKQEACLVAANLIQYHTEKTEDVRGSDLRVPIHTIDAANRHGLVGAELIEYDGTLNITQPKAEEDPDEGALLSPHVQKFYGGVIGADAREPLPTVTAWDHNALCAAHVVKYKGKELGQDPRDALNTITAQGLEYADCRTVLVKAAGSQNLYNWPQVRALLNEHCGYHLAEDEVLLLIIHGGAYFIADITLRMLTPRELYNAMGFPPDYIIDRDFMGNEYLKSDQVARCGNAVCPPLAEAMVRANLPEWCGAKFHTMEEWDNAVAV